jgi:hypothetical protein
MAYRKRKESKEIAKIRIRLQIMQDIDKKKKQTIEYGDAKDPVNSSVLESKLKARDELIASINQMLSKVDEKINDEKALDKELKTLSTRVLQGAKAKYGLDSNEVEILGGTKASERKKPEKKAKKKTEEA